MARKLSPYPLAPSPHADHAHEALRMRAHTPTARIWSPNLHNTGTISPLNDFSNDFSSHRPRALPLILRGMKHQGGRIRPTRGFNVANKQLFSRNFRKYSSKELSGQGDKQPSQAMSSLRSLVWDIIKELNVRRFPPSKPHALETQSCGLLTIQSLRMQS